MILTTGNLKDFIWDFLDVVWTGLITIRHVPELPAFTSATHKQPADLVNERRVSGSGTDRGNQRIMIAVKLEHLWAPLNHLLERVLASAALAMLIVAPRIDFSIFHQSQGMC